MNLTPLLGKENHVPGCVLRVAGPSFAPEKCVQAFPNSSISARGGGLNINVSDCDGDDVPGQTKEAEAFLRRHEALIRDMLSANGIRACLDFGVWQKEVPVQYVRVPASLAELAGRLGLEIEISIYAAR
jgi:hypothetical protein